MVTRHEFLGSLHTLLRPRTYLEIGVQHGWSLQLAGPNTRAVGIDPHPQLLVDVGAARIHAETSDDFFARPAPDLDYETSAGLGIDLAFIDGMHSFEAALRDFTNVERWANAGTVVAFDDVLPRNQTEAAREQCPGDWTGDVWRIEPILREHRPDLQMALVDTQPTGILLVWGLKPGSTELREAYDSIIAAHPLVDVPVPQHVMDRTDAHTPERVLDAVDAWRGRTP